MKAIVFSDSHGNLSNIDYLIEKNKPFDYIFGLGDYDTDFMNLELRDIISVRGNSSFDSSTHPLDYFYKNGSFKILFTHGHTHRVNEDLMPLYAFAKKNEVDIVFYGHTHVADIYQYNGITFINPGSISRPYKPSYPTYVTFIIDEKKCEIKILDILSKNIYKEIKIEK